MGSGLPGVERQADAGASAGLTGRRPGYRVLALPWSCFGVDRARMAPSRPAKLHSTSFMPCPVEVPPFCTVRAAENRSTAQAPSIAQALTFPDNFVVDHLWRQRTPISILEAGVGIEPAYAELQSAAWPLCHPAFVRGHYSKSPMRIPAPAARLGGFCWLRNWSGKRDSNSRPRPWQGRALPTELFPHQAGGIF